MAYTVICLTTSPCQKPHSTLPDQHHHNRMSHLTSRQATRFDMAGLTFLPILRIRIPTAETYHIVSKRIMRRYAITRPLSKPSKKPRQSPRTRLTAQRPRGDRAHPDDHRHAFPHHASRPQVCARPWSLPERLWWCLKGDEDPCE